MIYLIAAKEVSVCKIGYTKCKLEQRLRGIQGHNAFLLEILRVREGSRALERALHEKLKDERIRGEWFHLNDRVLKEFDNLEVEGGDAVTPALLAAGVGISQCYASQILSGAKKPSAKLNEKVRAFMAGYSKDAAA